MIIALGAALGAAGGGGGAIVVEGRLGGGGGGGGQEALGVGLNLVIPLLTALLAS